MNRGAVDRQAGPLPAEVPLPRPRAPRGDVLCEIAVAAVLLLVLGLTLASSVYTHTVSPWWMWFFAVTNLNLCLHVGAYVLFTSSALLRGHLPDWFLGRTLPILFGSSFGVAAGFCSILLLTPSGMLSAKRGFDLNMEALAQFLIHAVPVLANTGVLAFLSAEVRGALRGRLLRLESSAPSCGCRGLVWLRVFFVELFVVPAPVGLLAVFAGSQLKSIYNVTTLELIAVGSVYAAGYGFGVLFFLYSASRAEVIVQAEAVKSRV